KAGRFEPGTRLNAASNILAWWSEYVFGVAKARWDARGGPEDVARTAACVERARNASDHRRIMKNKKRRKQHAPKLRPGKSLHCVCRRSASDSFSSFRSFPFVLPFVIAG